MRLPTSTASAVNGARSLLIWKVNAFEAFPLRTRLSLFFQLLTPSFLLRASHNLPQTQKISCSPLSEAFTPPFVSPFNLPQHAMVCPSAFPWAHLFLHFPLLMLPTRFPFTKGGSQWAYPICNLRQWDFQVELFN